MDTNTDDTSLLFCVMAVVQEQITEDHTQRAGTVLAQISLFVATVKHYDRGKTQRQERKQKTHICAVGVQ